MGTGFTIQKVGLAAIATVMVAACLPGTSGRAVAGRAHASAAATPGASGLQLALSVPQSTLPRDALLPVTLRVRNVSTQPLTVGRDPEVRVIDHAGRIVYSATRDGFPYLFLKLPVARPSGGGGMTFVTLEPGRILVRHILVVVRADRLVPAVSVPHLGAADAVRGMRFVVGQRLRLHLVAGHRPRIRLTRRGLLLEAIITPGSPGVHGAPWYAQVEQCGLTTTGSDTWTRAFPREGNAFRLESTCLPNQWAIAVAWINQPVATLYYHRGHPSP